MTPDEPTEQDFEDMAAMGATLVRYQMTRNTRGFDESRLLDFAAYRNWLEGRLAKLEEILAWGDRYGIEVVVDMHHTPGGVEKRGLRINYRQDCLDEFVESWRVIAARFKGRRGIYGYDLVNEPRHRDGTIAAAQSGVATDKGVSWVETTVIGPGTLSFQWKLATDGTRSGIDLLIDGDYEDGLESDADWTAYSLPIDAGFHVIRWEY